MNDDAQIHRRFIVLTTQRTGSSWLMDRINSVPGGEGHMELFYHLPRREPPRAGCNDYPRFVEIGTRFGRRPRAVFDYLDRLYSRPGAVGFKLMYSQLRQYPETLAYIVRRRLHIVHLRRRNHLDVVLSECLARKTGRFHATTGEGYQQKGVIEVDAADVAKRVRRLDRKHKAMSTLLRLLPNPVFEVAYEDLCESGASFLELCGFIGLPGEQEDRSREKLIKTQRAPHRALIHNYDEVREALAGVGFQHLLN